MRGPGGGYQLNREPAGINVAEVIDAVNESVDATGCNHAGNCQGGEKCLTHHLWCDLSTQIHGFLSDISLANLVKRRDVKDVAERQDRRQLDNVIVGSDSRPAEAGEAVV